MRMNNYSNKAELLQRMDKLIENSWAMGGEQEASARSHDSPSILEEIKSLRHENKVMRNDIMSLKEDVKHMKALLHGTSESKEPRKDISMASDIMAKNTPGTLKNRKNKTRKKKTSSIKKENTTRSCPLTLILAAALLVSVAVVNGRSHFLQHHENHVHGVEVDRIRFKAPPPKDAQVKLLASKTTVVEHERQELSTKAHTSPIQKRHLTQATTSKNHMLRFLRDGEANHVYYFDESENHCVIGFGPQMNIEIKLYDSAEECCEVELADSIARDICKLFTQENKCRYLTDLCVEHSTEVFCDEAALECCIGSNDPTCQCKVYESICSKPSGEPTCDLAAKSCCDERDSFCMCDFFTFFSESKSTYYCKARDISEKSKSEDVDSLLKLYNATGGDSWVNNTPGWINGSSSHCQWYGITCNDDGFVTGINLEGNNLVGRSPFVRLPTELKTLNLASNNLSGTLPRHYLSSLLQLVDIDLSDNSFSGHAEMTFASTTTYTNFSNNNFNTVSFKMFNPAFDTLQVVDLSNNQIAQDTADILINIPRNLKEVIAFNNSIVGALPSPFPKVENLLRLAINNNSINGSLPQDLERSLPHLQELDVSHQKQTDFGGITGTIPGSMSKLMDLTVLNLAGNKLSQSIPSTIGSLKQLEELDLSSNLLSHTIPSELGRLNAALRVLDLSENMLKEKIPTELAKLEKADSVSLRGNLDLSSPAPLALCFMPSFDLMGDSSLCPTDDLSSLLSIFESTDGDHWYNNDGWPRKTRMAKADGRNHTRKGGNDYCQWYGITCDVNNIVTEIDLSSNNLTGTFKQEFDSKGTPLPLHLRYLKLANNSITSSNLNGSIFSWFMELEQIDLSDNHLGGVVDLSSFRSAKRLNFSYNDFTSINRTTRPPDGLHFVDLSYNRISQDVSNVFQVVPAHLKELALTSNAIKGALPKSFPIFEQLERLALGGNSVNGPLPEVLQKSFPRLKELDISNQTQTEGGGLTGTIPKEILHLDELSVLNMAGNKLSQLKQSSISTRIHLKELNLSSNLLSGTIPPSLGKLKDDLKVLDLSDNKLKGPIPSSFASLEETKILLDGNQNLSSPAPQTLCSRGPEDPDFDLKSNTDLCPTERNALREFYNSAKGNDWTRDDGWRSERKSHCKWYGVSCDTETRTRAESLDLHSNGLSGTLSTELAHLASLKVLDLSGNDIKGSIPKEIGHLRNLKSLRLSYNSFVGNTTNINGLTELNCIHLHGNRLSGTIHSPFNSTFSELSSFVADCGSPSFFNETLECKGCTMCCNAQQDCYPNIDSTVQEWGFKDYVQFSGCFIGVVLLIFFFIGVVLATYKWFERRGVHNAVDPDVGRLNKSEKKYLEDVYDAIGRDSVYKYLLGDSFLGISIALITVVLQMGLFYVFVFGAEIDLSDDRIDLIYTYKCHRDLEYCTNTADLTWHGWAAFGILMFAHLAKDLINGVTLIVLSSKFRPATCKKALQCFCGGVILCLVTLFTAYTTAVYNGSIATSNTEIIINAVIILFITDIDELLEGAWGRAQKLMILLGFGSDDDELAENFQLWATGQLEVSDSQGHLINEFGHVRKIVQVLSQLSQDIELSDKQKEDLLQLLMSDN